MSRGAQWFDALGASDQAETDFRFVGLHVSVLRALLAYGMNQARADQLVERAGRGPGAALDFEVFRGEVTVRVRLVRMRGGHAEAWEHECHAC
jgi:hypothetical protein